MIARADIRPCDNGLIDDCQPPGFAGRLLAGIKLSQHWRCRCGKVFEWASRFTATGADERYWRECD